VSETPPAWSDPRLLALTALGAVLRVFEVGAESLWIDEITTLDIVSTVPTHELFTFVPQYQPHFPTYYVLLDLWTEFIGTHPAVVRAPAVIFGILSVPLLVRLGSRLFDRPTGFLAGGLLAISSFQLAHAQEARMYTLVVLLTIVSTEWLVRALNGAGRRTALGYVVAASVLTYTHPMAGLAVLAQAFAVGVLHRDRVVELLGGRAVGILVAGGVVALPLAAFVFETFLSGIDLTFTDFSGVAIGETVLAFFGEWPYPAVAVSVACAVVLFAAIGGRDLRSNWRTALTVSLAVVPLGVLLVASYLVTSFLWPRYAIVAAPAWYVLVGRGLRNVALPAAGSLRSSVVDGTTGLTVARRAAVVALAVTLVAGTVGGTVAYHTTPDREQWDEAGDLLDRRASDDAVVLVSECITRRAVVRYTDRSHRIEGIVSPETATGLPQTDSERISRLVRSADEVWVVYSHVADREVNRIGRITGRTHVKTLDRSFVGVSVVRYEGNASVSTAPSTRCRDRNVPIASKNGVKAVA
jgi:mannosyltransferase